MHRLIRTLVLAATAIGAASAANLTFSNAVTFGATSTGDYFNGITSTSGCCQILFVEPDAFNAGVDAVTLPITLTNGVHTLYLESSDWTAGFGVSHGGVNLFFNGDSTPGISALIDPTFDKTDFSVPFVANASANSGSLSAGTVAASGSLSYTSGGATVTLIGLQWVGGSGSNPYDASLTVIRADVTVSGADAGGVPEPATFSLIGGALALAAAWSRRRRLRVR